MDNQMAGGMKCDCGHHSWLGIAVVVAGIVFLLGALEVLSAATVGIIWPILIIVAGGVMVMGRKCKCC